MEDEWCKWVPPLGGKEDNADDFYPEHEKKKKKKTSLHNPGRKRSKETTKAERERKLGAAEYQMKNDLPPDAIQAE